MANTTREGPASTGLVAILLTQRLEYPTGNPVWLDFWTSVYAALEV